jgi:hypothetical protein
MVVRPPVRRKRGIECAALRSRDGRTGANSSGNLPKRPEASALRSRFRLIIAQRRTSAGAKLERSRTKPNDQ